MPGKEHNAVPDSQTGPFNELKNYPESSTHN